jgi:hypothetical protein
MKKIIFYLPLVSIFALAAPSWYMHTDTKPYELIGYGEGDSVELAASRAKEDIASQLKTKIDSMVSQNTKVKNGKADKESAQKLRVTTEAMLSGVEKLKEEREGNTYYAAYRYDARPFEMKFAAKATKAVCQGKSGSTALEYTKLFTAIAEELGCRPKIKFVRQNGIYTISSQYAALAANTQIERMFFSRSSQTLSITPSKYQPQSGESISFMLKSQKEGYVSLFDVYDDGKVTAVTLNAKIKKAQLLKIPDDTNKDLEIAMSNNEGKNSTDMFVAVFSESELDLSGFERMDEGVATEKAYRLDELFWLMDKHTFATTVVKTVK